MTRRTCATTLVVSLAAISACDVQNPVEVDPGAIEKAAQELAIQPSRSASAYEISEPPALRRYDVDLVASGSFMPGQPLSIRATATSGLPAASMGLEIVLPEVEAAKLSSWGDEFRLPVGRPVPAAARGNARIGDGASHQLTHQIAIPSPGLYRVVATAEIAEQSRSMIEGRPVQDVSHKEIWLWIDEAGGEVFSRRPSPTTTPGVPRGVGPGTAGKMGSGTTMALVAESQPPVASMTLPSQVEVHVRYYDQDASTYRYLNDAKVDIDYYEWDGQFNPDLVSSSTQQTNSNGAFLLDCSYDPDPDEMWYEGYVEPRNSKVWVREWNEVNNGPDDYANVQSTIGADLHEACLYASAQYYEHDVGPSLFFHPFHKLSEDWIPASRDFFGHSRGRIEVAVEQNDSFPSVNSNYTSGPDRVRLAADHVWGSFGSFVITHEYGHAMHEKALDGNAAAGQCPSSGHSFDGAYNRQCAFSEGFANYHAAVTAGPGSSFYSDIIDRSALPATTGSGDPNDGSIIKGAVAAFLFDLTDSADDGSESFDNVAINDVYDGRYVADLIRTCDTSNLVYWYRADGIDQIIHCLEQQSPPDKSTFAQYFATAHDAFREDAYEPQGYPSAATMRTLWLHNLFDQ